MKILYSSITVETVTKPLASKNGEMVMSIARVTMVEWDQEDIMETLEPIYGAHRDKWFPQLEQVINIKTGPTSSISIAIYPSFEEAEENLEGRAEMVKLMKPHIRDQFFHEGEIIRNDLVKPEMHNLKTAH